MKSNLGRMPIKSIVSLVVISFTIVIGFQNCYSTNQTSKNSDYLPGSQSLGGGNGDPYGGKLSVYIYLQPGFSCPDINGVMQATYKEKIEIQDYKVTLYKNDCDKTTTETLAYSAM